MPITTTITSKGQLTIPKKIRGLLGMKTGVKVDIFPTPDGTAFIGKPKNKSKIMTLLGDLKTNDTHEPIQVIREKTQNLAAKEIVAKIKKNQ